MIYDSSILLNRSKTKKEIRSFNYRKIKLLSLQHSKNIDNKNHRYLNSSNNWKNRRIINENDLLRTKFKITNNLTNSNDTLNSFVKSNFSSCENIIKRAKEFHNNASNETDFTKKNDVTFLTEKNYNNNILHSLNFNSYLNDYLRNNNLMIFFRKSISNFNERLRIQRKIKFINNLCRNLIKTYKKDNYYDKFEEKVKKYELKYQNYKDNMNNYLSFLKNQKIKEEYDLGMLKKKKVKLIENIHTLNTKIDKYKSTINEYIEIKNFLIKVKGNKKERDLSPNNNIEIIPDINLNIKSADSIQRLEKKEQINKSIINTNFLKLYLSPIKQRKNINNFINININGMCKTPKNLHNKIDNRNNKNLNKQSKFNQNISKSAISLEDKPIFSSPDEFIYMYEKKIISMRNLIDHHNKVLKSINNLQNENLLSNKLSKEDKYDKKFAIYLNSLKKENIILNNKLNECKKIKMDKEFNLITKQAKEMILNINLFYNLNKKFNINFNSNFEKPVQNEQNKNGKNINKNIYLIKILEKITEVLIAQDKKYKGDHKIIERYKRIKTENENVKFAMIRKRQINNLRLQREQKNRIILEYHRKIRFFPLNKNGINLNYFNNSTRYCISSSIKDELVDKKIKSKREEIKGLLYYN